MIQQPKSGLAFHQNHDTLIDFCPDYDARVKSIKKHKPFDKQELLLRLFQIVPENRLPPSLYKAGVACGEAKQAFDEATEDYIKAGEALDQAEETVDQANEAVDQAEEALDKADEVYGKTKQVFDEALEYYDKTMEDCMPEIVQLHIELCPNCPFDGNTIFTRKDKDGKWY